MTGKREYGDYQTPAYFTDRVCNLLKEERGIHPDIVIEPTCGTGNFLRSSLIFNAKKYYGMEINPAYCAVCERDIKDDRVEIINTDIFSYDIRSLETGNVLVIGNPPWVTSYTLSSLGSANVPTKENFKGLKGIDAMTGGGNFDICENIILKFLLAFENTSSSIAMLCKTTVARSVFKEMKRRGICFEYCDIFTFDAAKVFAASAPACLLLIRLTDRECRPDCCNVYSLDDAENKTGSFSCRNGKICGDLTLADMRLDGICPFEWRQGVKHDCARVMELSAHGGRLVNGRGETVEIEGDIVFPLVKGKDMRRPVISSADKYVIVTQGKVREDTAHLKEDVPRTWAYLCDNRSLFDARKSSVYNGAPAFSMFGIGPYSFSPYKVGISGFYKQPMFCVLSSPDGKPVMTDDTCYFLCFPSFDLAYTAMLYLNCDVVISFLKSISFSDDKRPFTKKVLQRLDFCAICRAVTFDDLLKTEARLALPGRMTKSMTEEFAAFLRPAGGEEYISSGAQTQAQTG